MEKRLTSSISKKMPASQQTLLTPSTNDVFSRDAFLFFNRFFIHFRIFIHFNKFIRLKATNEKQIHFVIKSKPETLHFHHACHVDKLKRKYLKSSPNDVSNFPNIRVTRALQKMHFHFLFSSKTC